MSGYESYEPYAMESVNSEAAPNLFLNLEKIEEIQREDAAREYAPSQKNENQLPLLERFNIWFEGKEEKGIIATIILGAIAIGTFFSF